MKVIYKTLIFFLLISFVVALLISVNDETSGKFNHRCNWSSAMKAKSFEGRIVGKYKDEWNHMKPTLVIDSSKKKEKIHFLNELGGFYSKMTIGNNISKSTNSLEVKVGNGHNVQVYILNYGCPAETINKK